MLNDNYAIQLENVCFGYEKHLEVLHNINIAVEKGSFAIIVGPNGGGKTTLLRLVLGLLRPRHGFVRVLGQNPEAARRQVAYVPQSLLFDPAFPASALDVVLMGRVERHFFGTYRKRDREKAQKSLQLVGLKDFARRSFADLSGGERQRVLIAQALASEPELLLLDEPSANLDPDGAHHFYELLKELNQHLTLLMVSHNLNVVEAFASHIICVNRTADIHTTKELNCKSQNDGDWLQLSHQKCPIGRTNEDFCRISHLCGKKEENGNAL